MTESLMRHVPALDCVGMGGIGEAVPPAEKEWPVFNPKEAME
jgi:hypothetical protein